LAERERADVVVPLVGGARSRSLTEEDGTGGMVVVGTEENPVGEESMPRLAGGAEASDGLGRKAEQDFVDDVRRQHGQAGGQLCRLTASTDTFRIHASL
jgi:hypothetical protein